VLLVVLKKKNGWKIVCAKKNSIKMSSFMSIKCDEIAIVDEISFPSRPRVIFEMF
jgi:hypothetical protein